MRGLIITGLLMCSFIAKTYCNYVSIPFKEDPPTKMMLYQKLQQGDSAMAADDFAKAESYYKEAIIYTEDIVARGGTAYRSMLLESIFNSYERLGQLYFRSNNFKKAAQYYSKSKEAKDKHLPRHSVFRASPYIGLGSVSFRQGDLAAAYSYFNQAEKIINRATTSFYDFGIPHREVWMNLFEILMQQKKYREAYKYLRRISIGGRYNRNDPTEQTPRVFEMKARYYLEAKNYREAEYYLDKAKAYLNPKFSSGARFRILKTETLLHWSEKKLGTAAITFDRLMEAYRDHIQQNFASMSEYERESFYASFRDDFDLFNAFIVSHPEFSESKSLYGQVYNVQLFSKALLLNEINKLKQQIYSSGNADLKRKLEDWSRKKTELTNLYFGKNKNPVTIAQLESRIEELEGDLNRASRMLRSVGTPVRWQNVQQALSQDEAAIEIVRVRNYNIADFKFSDSIAYLFLVVDPQRNKPGSAMALNGQDLESKYLHYYRNCISSQLTDTISFNKFWSPLLPLIRERRKLFISSDGVYNQLNLNTLLNPRSGKYLMDEKDLRFVTNTRDILKKNHSHSAHTASLYGRPQFRMDSIRFNAQSIVSNTTRSLDNESMDSFRDQEFVDLPGTENEIQFIKKDLAQHGWSTTVRLGEQASESNVKAEHKPTVLHLATHGFFMEGESNNVSSMIRSGLILSGVNNSGNQNDDGILTAYEATNLDLDSTYLVVLSACETGGGEVKNGEGVYGLQRGFIVAGAQYLLMSLWKVDDVATSFLMEKIYSAWLSGDDLHHSVKEAQASLRQQYPQPYYWGSFLLFGK